MSTSFERLDAIVGSLQVGILAVDGDGAVQLQNPEASRILGVSSEITLGRPLALALGADHPAVPLLERARRTERPVSAHACTLPSRFGAEPLVVDLAAAPIGPEDESAGAVLTLRDRTIGRELESLVDQRTRSEVFAHLASGIAHELGNPLGGIRGAAELLLGKLQDPALRRYPELICAETDRMRRLLRDLAELTPGGSLQPQPTNVHRVLDDILELQRQASGWSEIDVRREYDPSIPEIELDPDRMTQVFLNLIRNAVQSMPQGGTLTIRTRVESTYQISPESPLPSNMVRIDIEDTGKGIAEEHLPHIFTPFFTGRPEGTGLGLPIAEHWTVRHGGSLQVTSRTGEGTRARVLLPLRRRT
jgi:two-component system nitrogen regulation sensor histidine kinase GlnL